jgi:hypothetical protein
MRLADHPIQPECTEDLTTAHAGIRIDQADIAKCMDGMGATMGALPYFGCPVLHATYVTWDLDDDKFT